MTAPALVALIDAELARRGIARAPSDWADDLGDLPELARIAARLEPGLAREFRRAVNAARDRVSLDALEAAVRAGHAERVIELFEAAGIWSEFLGPARRELARAVLAGGQVGATELARLSLAIDFTLVNPHAVEWAGTRTAEFVTEVSGAQRITLQDIVADAVAGETDVRGAARLIRDVVGLTQRQADAVATFRARLADEGIPAVAADTRTAKYAAAQLKQRAETIARTEILDAANEGQQSLWHEAKKQGLLDPAKTRRVVIVTHDDRLDLEICEPLDGAEATLDGPFPGGYLRPPFHPRCRCSVGLKFA